VVTEIKLLQRSAIPRPDGSQQLAVALLGTLLDGKNHGVIAAPAIISRNIKLSTGSIRKSCIG
jgi:hypothetical protein